MEEPLVDELEDEAERQREAATRLAAMQRGKLARKRLREEQEAAAKVQAIQRGRIIRAENKVTIRKRDSAIKSWSTTANENHAAWQGSLRTADVAGDEEADVASRFLQGTQLDANASVEDQLREALSQNLVRVTDLFRTWDENSDGTVSKSEFRRAVKLLGLHAEDAAIDAVFDGFDPDASGTIEFRELNGLLRKTVEEAPETKRPSLLDKSLWKQSTAKVLVGKRLSVEVSQVEKLREALASKQVAMINVFRKMDLDGDGHVTRAEFLRALPRIGLPEGAFSREDMDQLFSDLDQDRSGSIAYKELDKILRRDAHSGADEEQKKLAQKLFKRTDLVVILGASTRSKKAFVQRLAYTFSGTWLSARTLAERELTCFGSRLAGEVRRRSDANKPLPTSLLMSCLHAAVEGRSDNGPLPPLRGPFFLYDVPRSLKELGRLEKAFGVTPLTIHFEQTVFEEGTHFEDAQLDEMLAAHASGQLKSQLLKADAEEEVKLIVGRVLKYMRVQGMRQRLQERDTRKAAAAEKARIHEAQRKYLEAVSGLMADALTKHGSATSAFEHQKTKEQRQFYLSPRGLAERKLLYRLEKERLREEEAAHELDGVLPSSPSAASQHSPPRSGGARSPTATTYAERESVFSSPSFYQTSSVPGGHAGTSAGNLTARARLNSSPPRVQPLFEPRIDLQLSPRNWREPTPPGVPVSLSLPAVKSVYGTSLPWDQVVTLPPVAHPPSSASPRSPSASTAQLHSEGELSSSPRRGKQLA